MTTSSALAEHCAFSGGIPTVLNFRFKLHAAGPGGDADLAHLSQVTEVAIDRLRRSGERHRKFVANAVTGIPSDDA
jgi:hypothetical protein